MCDPNIQKWTVKVSSCWPIAALTTWVMTKLAKPSKLVVINDFHFALVTDGSACSAYHGKSVR